MASHQASPAFARLRKKSKHDVPAIDDIIFPLTRKAMKTVSVAAQDEKEDALEEFQEDFNQMEDAIVEAVADVDDIDLMDLSIEGTCSVFSLIYIYMQLPGPLFYLSFIFLVPADKKKREESDAEDVEGGGVEPPRKRQRTEQ